MTHEYYYYYFDGSFCARCDIIFVWFLVCISFNIAWRLSSMSSNAKTFQTKEFWAYDWHKSDRNEMEIYRHVAMIKAYNLLR